MDIRYTPPQTQSSQTVRRVLATLGVLCIALPLAVAFGRELFKKPAPETALSTSAQQVNANVTPQAIASRMQ